MARRKLDLLDLDTVEPAAGSYAGPMPPDGLYRVRLTRVTIKPNRNDDDRMAASLVVAHDPDAPKAMFNGAYGNWSANVTPQGKRYIKSFADALGFTAREMANPDMDGEDDELVVKFGNKTIGTQMARVGLKKRSYTANDGSRGFSMDVVSITEDTGELEHDPVGKIVEDDDDLDLDGGDDEYDTDTYTGEDDAEPEAENDEYDDAEAQEEGDAEDDEAEGDDADEYEDEPTPAPRKAVKAPPAKATKAAPAKAPAKKAAGRKPF